eukprot:6210531-Pleurochrysis_carterae.AAC.4
MRCRRLHLRASMLRSPRARRAARAAATPPRPCQSSPSKSGARAAETPPPPPPPPSSPPPLPSLASSPTWTPSSARRGRTTTRVHQKRAREALGSEPRRRCDHGQRGRARDGGRGEGGGVKRRGVGGERRSGASRSSPHDRGAGESGVCAQHAAQADEQVVQDKVVRERQRLRTKNAHNTNAPQNIRVYGRR